jgi:sulfane dehydrogenase subunit SoxC
LGNTLSRRNPFLQGNTPVRDVKLRPHELTSPLTDVADLFVLAHFGVPRVDPARWLVSIAGMVERPRSFTLEELKARPKRVVEAVHQCCGNPLEPAVPARRVANVRWGGADLGALLDEAGIDPAARFVWSFGVDGGEFAGTHSNWYVKDLPVQRLAAGEVLLAYELNGAPLPAEHGFPVRLVVPGYYATNSVKWLWRIQVAERRTERPFTTMFYNDDPGEGGAAAGRRSRPVWAIAPESIIVKPAPDAVIGVYKPAEIRGWAWCYGGAAAVEITFDEGASFTRAALAPRRGWEWQSFSLLWLPLEPGEVHIGARAIDAGGVAQPLAGARNAMHSVRVLVR